MIRRSTLLALEILLGLMAALLIGVGVVAWRLSQGPVELNFIRQTVQTELSEARQGRPVGIERVELAWSSQANALELRAVGVTVEDGRGGVLSRSEEARIELDALPLLIGRISLVRADFLGGAITFTRKLDGVTHIAFGPPDTPPDIIIAAPPAGETLDQRVARLLDGMEAAFRPVGPGGRLRGIALRNAQLAIIDERGGGRWTADAATLELARNGEVLAFVGSARLEGEQGAAPASLRITTDTAFQSAVVEFGAEQVRPRALLSPAALGPFAGLDAPLTATISIGLDRVAGVNRLEGDVTLGEGSADMAGGRFSLDGGSLRGRYDIESDELILDQLQLAGERTSIRGEVRVRDVSAIMRAAPGEPAAFNISLPAMTLDVPGGFSEPINLSEVEAVGAIVSNERAIDFTRLHARVGEGVVDASGRLYWADVGVGEARRSRMGARFQGAMAGSVSAQQVMSLWPVGLGEGARDYLARSITAGRVSDVTLNLNIQPADLVDGVLDNAAMDVRFNVADVRMRFIETMAELTDARGSGVLRGNSFTMEVPEARLNGLAVTNGHIDAPRLKPRGEMLTISARAEGDARNIMEVLLQEPLGLGDRLPVSAESAVGRGRVDLRLQRPMRSDVAFEDYRFTINGQLENFGGTMTTRRMAVSNGHLQVRGDHRAIAVTGPIRAGQSNVDVRWTEHLNRRGRASSEYQISGDFDARDLERLGYSVAQYAEGRVGVVVSGDGRGFDVDNATVEVDLRAAAVESPWAFWTKRAGLPASARFTVVRQSDGGLAFESLDARGGGLVAQGRVRISRNDQIMEVALPRLVIEGRSDARLTATRAADGGLDVEVRGALFDAAPFMDESDPPATRAARAATVEPPVRARVIVDRLKMRGDATLSNARVELTTYRGALAMLIADGAAPGGRPFSLGLGPRPGDPSGRIAFRSEDAGFAMRALTGSENVVGGRVEASGDWRTGPPSSARFNVRMRDFQVVRLPAMARLLSSAGSLTGLVEMLNGDGIGFSNLEAQMVYANNQITFTEGAMRGPSLGLTASGGYDIDRDDLDVDGVVAPSYGLNSLLGNVPIVGDLFVSRRGEGVVGMTYSINGRAGEPRVGVNPLSAFTPGILRRIFEPLQAREPAAPPAGGAHSLELERDAPAPDAAIEVAPLPELGAVSEREQVANAAP